MRVGLFSASIVMDHESSPFDSDWGSVCNSEHNKYEMMEVICDEGPRGFGSLTYPGSLLARSDDGFKDQSCENASVGLIALAQGR